MEAGPTDKPLHRSHLHAATDRGSDHLRVGDKIVRNLLLRDKGLGIGAWKLHARKAIMPGGTICNRASPIFLSASVRQCGAAR